MHKYSINHIGFHKDIVKTPSTVLPKVLQIFIADPNGYHFYYRTDATRKKFKDFYRKEKITVYVHGRYMDVPWNISNKGLLTYIRREMQQSVDIGAYGFVLHLYKTPIIQVGEVLERLKPPQQIKLFLENSAIKQDPYSNPQEIIALYKYLEGKLGYNIGICIDTAHLWSSGVDVRSLSVIKNIFEPVMKEIPMPDLLVHLNDSETPMGSGIDRHATVGQGMIWNSGQYDSLKYIINLGINIILERDHSVKDDYLLIKKLIVPK